MADSSAIFTTRLFIEGSEVDLSGQFDGTITYALDNIKDLSTISSNYSKTITVPATKKNSKLFNFLFNPAATNQGSSGSRNIGSNFDFKKKSRAYVICDNQVIMQGYAKLVSATINDYNGSFELQISSDLTGLIFNLGDTRLEDLYPASGASTPYDTQLTLANITGSWNISSSDAAQSSSVKVLFPLIDYGEVDTVNGQSWLTQNIRPCLYLKQIWDLCMTTASYTYEGNWFTSSYAQSLIFPYKDGQMLFTSQNVIPNITASANASQSVVIRNYNQNDMYIYNGTYGSNYNAGKFIPSVAGIYNFNAAFYFQFFLDSYNGSVEKLNTDFYCYVRVEIDKVSDNSFQRDYFTSFKIPKNSFDFYDVSFTSSLQYANVSLNDTVYINTNEYAKVGITFTATETNDIYFNNPDDFQSPGSGSVYVYAANSTVNVNTSTTLDGNTITYNQMIPKDVKCTDFVQSVLRTWNLYPVPDKDQPQHFHIYTHDEFYQGNNIVLDWTGKLDTKQDFKVTPIPQLDTAHLLFSFRPDSDYFNNLYTSYYGGGTYGQLLLSTGYQFGNDTKDVLSDTIFSPTVPVQYSNNYIPAEHPCEILSGSNTVSLSGYSASFYSATSSSLSDNPFSHARKGVQIVYFGQAYTIQNVINPQQFVVDRPLVRPYNISPQFTATQDVFYYITNNTKTIPTMYQSKDLNVTRSPLAVNPRVLCYNGLRPCNPYYVQYTPTIPAGTTQYAYYSGDTSSMYYYSSSYYPYVSHIYDSTNFDTLFAEPNGVFFNVTNYPSGNLFNYWQNTVYEITDEESKLVNCTMNLNSIDIANLDFSNTIQVGNTYYRVNQIIDYNPDPSTETQVELVRLPFQQYASNVQITQSYTGSAIYTSSISASLNQYVSSSITGIQINGFNVVYTGTGSNFTLSGSEHGLFRSNQIGNWPIKILLNSSSSIHDTIFVTDGIANYTGSISFTGSGYVLTNKTFSTSSIVSVFISGSTNATASAPMIATIINGTEGKIVQVLNIAGWNPSNSAPAFTTVSHSYSPFNNSIGVQFTATSSLASTLYLKKNGVTLQTIGMLAHNGATQIFSSQSFASGDQLLIDWEDNS